MDQRDGILTEIAIIGAGLAGLTLAHRLKAHARVSVFEKSRGPGGRMATRYADPYRFDHGAQFFTARTGSFKSFLEPLIANGVIAPWRARFVEFDGSEIVAERQWDSGYPHYVGTPGMNAIGRFLARDLDVRLNTTVNRPQRRNGLWSMETDNGVQGPFDWVIVTAPAAQAAALLPPECVFREQVSSIRQLSCYALMLGFDRPPVLAWQAALVRNADISWISVNSSKPGRTDHVTLLVHATNAWADAHIDDDIEDVMRHMIGQLESVTGIDAGKAEHIDAHRWRYANIAKQHSEAAFVDRENRLIACGDWCIRGRVEAAFTSAAAAFDAVIA